MKVHDEVCGMTIEREQAVASTLFQDTRYHFCSTRCREKFLEHPGWYVPIKPEVEETRGG